MKQSQRKKRRKVKVPVASMGDIAFLLIIFFMLLSDAAKDKDLQLELPISSHIEKTEIDVVAHVAVDSSGVIYIDGQAARNAEDVEVTVRAMLASTVADEQRHVQFKCDASQMKNKFEPVLKAIAAAGGIVEAVGVKNE